MEVLGGVTYCGMVDIAELGVRGFQMYEHDAKWERQLPSQRIGRRQHTKLRIYKGESLRWRQMNDGKLRHDPIADRRTTPARDLFLAVKLIRKFDGVRRQS